MPRYTLTINAPWSRKIQVYQRKDTTRRGGTDWKLIRTCNAAILRGTAVNTACVVLTKAGGGWGAGGWTDSPARIKVKLTAGGQSATFQSNVGSSTSHTYYLHSDNTISTSAEVGGIKTIQDSGNIPSSQDINAMSATCRGTAQAAGQPNAAGWYYSVFLGSCQPPTELKTPGTSTEEKAWEAPTDTGIQCLPGQRWSLLANACVEQPSGPPDCPPGLRWDATLGACAGQPPAPGDAVNDVEKNLDELEDGNAIQITEEEEEEEPLLPTTLTSPIGEMLEGYALPLGGVALGALAATMLERRALVGALLGGAAGTALIAWQRAQNGA